MTRKIIIYNSFTHDANPHETLLRNQLDEVNAELKSCSTKDQKVLVNERRLLQRKLRSYDKDGVGTPEEVAYGKGWHEKGLANPYDEPALKAAWERGRKAAETKNKLRGNYRQGELRNKSFEAPRGRDAPIKPEPSTPKMLDYKSERGYVGKIINTASGKMLARSEPFISENSARRWAAEQAPKFRTMRTKAEFEMVFYDPERV